MEIFPAIDLQNGNCVRLTQGDFSAATIYESDPLRMAKKFADAGARWLHVVDLDGAREGLSQQMDIVASIARQVPINLQVGGGIRSEKTIARLLNDGVKRVVVGSLAVRNRKLVKQWLLEFGPDRVVLAFDIRLTNNQPEVLAQGWQSGSQQLLWDVLDAYEGSGLKHLLCTDVSRDGMLSGTNHALYRAIRERHPEIGVIASGGVDGIDDLLVLAQLGVASAIVGKAIYEGRIDLATALEVVAGAEAMKNAG